MSDSVGKIMLVGIGPGSHDHMTQRARLSGPSVEAEKALASALPFACTRRRRI